MKSNQQMHLRFISKVNNDIVTTISRAETTRFGIATAKTEADVTGDKSCGGTHNNRMDNSIENNVASARARRNNELFEDRFAI